MDNRTGLFHKPKKKIASKLLLVLALLTFAFFLVFDINWLRPQLNQTISSSSGSQINIGKIDFSWLNPSALTLEDIKIQQAGLDASIAQVAVKIDFWQLFKRNLIVEHISLESPNFAIDASRLQQKEEQEPAPSESSEPVKLTLGEVTVHQLLISDLAVKDASVASSFAISGTNIRLTNLELVKNNLFNPESHLPGAKIQMFLANLVLQQREFGSIKLLAQSEVDKIIIEQLKVEQSPSMIDLSSTVHLPFDTPTIELTANDNKLMLDQFADPMQDSSIKPQGLVTFSASFKTSIDPENSEAALQNLVGSFNATMQPGKVTGIDVNSALTALKDSQQTSLLDIGGYILTGPLGLIAGQLLDLGTGVTALGGETQINHLSLVSKIEQGKVDLTDTAIATNEYRVALKGKADIIKQEFDNFEFAILNDKGCADVSQSLNGPMNNPTSAVADSLLKSIASPVTDIISEVKETVSDCDVFYSGPVQQP